MNTSDYQSCLVELPTSSIYYTSACSQLSTHSLKKTVKSCETHIESITYSDTHNMNWKYRIDSQSCLTKHEQEAYFVAWKFYHKVWSSQVNSKQF